jgi:hypothetical protein
VRAWFTLLALLCFVPQQFTCCAQSCGACTEPCEESHETASTCDHDHGEHDHEAPSTPHDHSSHHLCVATHLFYLVRTDAGSQLPDLCWTHAVLPAQEAVVDLQFDRPLEVMASHSVSPHTAGHLRALLSVWII